MTTTLSTIETAIAAIAAGKMVIVVDDEQRENEGDLVIAAEFATPENINFMATHGRGLICLTLTETDFKRLDIPMMTDNNQAPHATAFGVSFEAAQGVTTGISAHDRATTISVAIDENSTRQDIVIPGHVFPLKSQDQGVLVRPGHTEASIDLARLASLKPAGVLCEILNPDGTMARLPQLQQFAEQHHLPIISIQDLINYRLQHENIMTEISAAAMPIRDKGQFRIVTFQNDIDHSEIIALIAENTDTSQPCLVRLHSECLTGDVFGSSRCDCGHQLDLALSEIAQQGGVLLYLHQEGRGIGLANKIKAYHLQDQGLDTVEANQRLGFAADERDYSTAAQVLRILGLTQVRLLTNNPRKVASLERHHIHVIERIPLETEPTVDNLHYLKTKQQKLGHWLNLDEEPVKHVN